MRISETEREIICAAHLDADQTVGDMARRTGYKEHTVRYAIEKLKRERILIPHPFINLSPLGYHQYTIFFSVTSESRLNIDALMRLMVNSQRVSWVGRLGGEYQYGISVCARSPGEVSEFLDETSNTFGPVFYDKTIAVIVSLTHFRMNYLSTKQHECDHITLAEVAKKTQIDEVDHRILSGLETEVYNSHSELATKLRIPPSTLEYRMRSLHGAGILHRLTYLCNTSKLGVEMYLLLLSVKSVSAKLRLQVFKFCQAHRSVNFVIEYLGAWDYEVGVEVPSGRDIMRITGEFYAEFGDVLNLIRVFQVFDYPKVSKYPFRDFSFVCGRSITAHPGGRQ